MSDLTTLIQQVGFPIAVAIFLLWRYERRLKEMTNVLSEVNTTLTTIKIILERNGRGKK